MKFTVTAAKYHVLQGLHLADADGVWFETDTKFAMLEAGLVYFLHDRNDGECPYRVACPEEFNIGPMINGTDDPVSVAIAKRVREADFTSSWEWVSIPVEN